MSRMALVDLPRLLRSDLLLPSWFEDDRSDDGSFDTPGLFFSSIVLRFCFCPIFGRFIVSLSCGSFVELLPSCFDIDRSDNDSFNCLSLLLSVASLVFCTCSTIGGVKRSSLLDGFCMSGALLAFSSCSTVERVELSLVFNGFCHCFIKLLPSCFDVDRSDNGSSDCLGLLVFGASLVFSSYSAVGRVEVSLVFNAFFIELLPSCFDDDRSDNGSSNCLGLSVFSTSPVFFTCSAV
mmetsp:Transcript_22382/g.52842  ORF Transcript_22382/g.52842 Transcript_22382/m.52842 type:complete len:236 (-) Transcript_22382:1176-1883(-)